MSVGSRGSGSPRRSCPTRRRTPTIWPDSGEKVVGSIHMSWAKSDGRLNAMATTTSHPRRRNIDEQDGCDVMVSSLRSKRFGTGDPVISNPWSLVLHSIVYACYGVPPGGGMFGWVGTLTPPCPWYRPW